MFDVDITRLPLEYWLCIVVIALAGAFSFRMRREAWAAPYIAVLGTVAAWYMVEPIYFDDFLYDFTPEAVATAYRCLLVFLTVLTASTPFIMKAMRPKTVVGDSSVGQLHAEHLVPWLIVVWLGLLCFGVYRMEGDLFGSLFPLEGRAANVNMWGRSAAEDAGSTGFIVSTAAYIYVLILSLFGLLLPLARDSTTRVVLVVCILVSWPYAILQGSRNITLAVVTPMLAAYLLIGRRRPAVKVLIAVAGFALVDLLMRAIIEFRNIGFEAANFREVEHAQHLGLNMASELIYSSSFIDMGAMNISWGWGYLSELLNVVPRAFWNSKPVLGIDYAVARGFAGGETDIGVIATLSTGIVGQGVLNFGLWFGPAAAALLMSSWIGMLTRLRMQGGTARTALFLVGLGSTFNLGRDFTLLVLFPFVFGYIGVLFIEAKGKIRAEQIRLESQREQRIAAQARALANSARQQFE
jgi:hypothetical protein